MPSKTCERAVTCVQSRMRGLCARACACVHVQVHVLQRACVARVYKYIIHIYNVDVRGVDVMWRACNGL